MSTKELSFVEAIREALREEMHNDETIFLMGEDIRLRGLAKELWEEFGDNRVINTPIAESGFTGAAIGAAITGMKPVVCHMRCDFMLYALDSIANQAAKWNYQTGMQFGTPIVIRAGTGGYRGSGCHHSQSLEALFMNVPGLHVAIPSSPYDAKGLMKTALKSNRPVLFFEHGQLMNVKGQVPEADYTIPFGVADTKRAGKDVTVVATAFMVHKTLNVADKLEREGISLEVIDPRTLVPLDRQAIIDSVGKTGRLVTVEEGCKTSGIGAEVAAIVAESVHHRLRAPIKRIANPDAMVPYKFENEKHVLPQEEDIADAVKDVIQQGR